MLYRAAFEFGVTRRIDWADDLPAFHGHVERVRERIEARQATADVRLIADMRKAALTVDFEIEADTEEQAGAMALDIVSLAIRECGGRHLGLFSIAEESRMKSRLNAFSGLRTPVWQARRVLVATAA